ncbi:Regulator of microtubule dynamics protein 1, partial [Geodia barretti]
GCRWRVVVWAWLLATPTRRCAIFGDYLAVVIFLLLQLCAMSSSSSGSGSLVSWSVTAAGVLAGLGAGYALGMSSSSWLTSSRSRRPSRAAAVEGNVSGNLVAALVELTAEIARLRQTVESCGVLPCGGQLPPSRRSMRGASTADFVSAQEDNTESDDEFFDPNEGEGEREGEGESSKMPDYGQLDELGHSCQANQDTCETLIRQIRTALSEFEDDVGLLWRLARALFHLSNHVEQERDTEGQKQLVQEALEQCERGLEVDDGVWEVHQWYAIAIGSLTKYEGTQRKIEMGYKYKEHIDKAISLSPEEKTLHHLRGRFCYEVAGVSWLEKKAAAALFGSPPESSYEEALESLMKAEERSSEDWKTNALYIAKCHLKLSDVPTAVEWLHKAHNMPTSTPEDFTAQTEVEELLTQNDPTFDNN